MFFGGDEDGRDVTALAAEVTAIAVGIETAEATSFAGAGGDDDVTDLDPGIREGIEERVEEDGVRVSTIEGRPDGLRRPDTGAGMAEGAGAGTVSVEEAMAGLAASPPIELTDEAAVDTEDTLDEMDELLTSESVLPDLII